jgi:hypothetical protein
VTDQQLQDLGVAAWLTLPDVAERLGTDVGRVRSLVQERHLVVLRGADGVARVPEGFLVREDDGWVVLPGLHGTLVLLADAGYSDEEAVRWLFTPDPTLAVHGRADDAAAPTPVDALAAGQKREVRRRAQALGF